MANITNRYFLGNAQTVMNSTTNITSANYSGTPTATYNNTTDALYPYAKKALVTAQFPAWGGAPVAGGYIELRGVAQNVDSTNDETGVPSGTANSGAHYFGKFDLSVANSLQRYSLVIDVEGYNEIDFYFGNFSGQQMTNNGGTNFVVKVQPLVDGVTV